MWTGMVDFYLIGHKSGNHRLELELLALQELSGCSSSSYGRAERGFNHLNTLGRMEGLCFDNLWISLLSKEREGCSQALSFLIEYSLPNCMMKTEVQTSG